MAITAALVKELRERTGAGMMECKKALMETHGDIEAAIDTMRKSGQAKAAKKAGRVAAEGLIVIEKSTDNKQAVILEVNSETDFVARDDHFIQFAEKIAKQALQAKVKDLPQLLSVGIDSHSKITVEQARQELVAKLGENINIRRVVYCKTNHTISTYIHGGRIGVLVEINGGDIDLAKNIAMHIAASHPIAIDENHIPTDVVNKEKEIITNQAKESGKPANIVEKMVAGRIKKFMSEITLLGQPFIRDPEVSVGELLQKAQANVITFTRFEVGEGIEKKASNFVAEVMAQARGE